MHTLPADPSLIDSRQAAWRLLATLGLVVLGNSSMYVVSVVLPAVLAGAVIPLMITKVLLAGTSATDILVFR